MSLLMALLKGLDGVRSVVSSQLTLHPVTDWLSDMKADVDMVRLLESASQLKGVFDNVPGSSDFDHEVDTLAWNVPLPPGEACKNPVCRRVFAIFGPSYAHGRLNHWTHVAMREMFGRVSLKPFEQLTRIMQRGQVLDALGNDSYLQQPAARLALPIGFIAGEMNQLFFPETSARTFVWLRARNDPALYTRRQFPGYAHMDLFVGRDAARDIFPAIVQELERADAMLDATAGTPATR
jgi:cholesterol oxidase